MEKQVVAGLGEIGRPILELIMKVSPAIGYDIEESLIDKEKIKKYEKYPTTFLHICIPFTEKFIANIISLNKKFKPKCIVIHSTISPNTTTKIQTQTDVPVMYSATRGVHKRMLFDLRRYTKFFAVDPNVPNATWAAKEFSNLIDRKSTRLNSSH